MAEIIQKRDVVRAKDLNIVVYEDPSMSEGLSYKFDAQVALDVGCEPVFTESLDELAQAIDHMETLPDAIIIKDKSTPSVRDVMPEIAFSDALLGAMGHNTTPRLDKGKASVGVHALTLLKNENSPVKDVPVIIWGAFSEESFRDAGADAVITSTDMMYNKCIQRTLETLLGKTIRTTAPNQDNSITDLKPS